MDTDLATRRKILIFLSSFTSVSVAGCSEHENRYTGNDDEQDTQETVGTENEVGDGETNSEEGGSSDIVDEIDLPDEPVESTGEIDIQQAEVGSDYTQEGYSTADDKVEIDDFYTEYIERNRSERVVLNFTTQYRGSGRVSGFAFGSFRTAWKSPESGTYRFIIPYEISNGQINYDNDGDGDAGISIGVFATVTNQESSEVVAEETQSIIQHSSGSIDEDLEEQMVTTALTLLAGKVLGIGLLGRAFLKIALSGIFNTTSEESYDVQKTASKFNEVVVDFSAEEDEVFILEFTPFISKTFEHEDSRVVGYSRGTFDVFSFQID